MFSFGSGKAGHPNPYTGANPKKRSKSDIPTSMPRQTPSDSLEPAIDGPPSPGRIRAYTEQMKKTALFGNNSSFSNHSRTNTFSSATSSSRSRDSTYTGPDNVSLSRKSSSRSNASSMPSIWPDRPESAQGFGSIFSRTGRRRRATLADSLRTSNSSLTLGEMSEGSARDHYYGSKSEGRRKLISEPYNFQHVTHTRQEQLPNLEHTSGTELVSEFSAIRASQVPTNGELKGIRAQDLHFENFSSEAVNTVLCDDSISQASSKSPRQKQRAVLRKSISPSHQRAVSYAKSYDNLRTPVTPLRAPPPRPPRSPLSPECPIDLPVRTSSRMISVLFDSVDPMTATSIERPYTSGAFRKPAPFNLPTPPPPQTNEPQEYFSNRPVSHALSTPTEGAWPLTASPTGNFGVELADVQEEDEDERRKSRFSTPAAELQNEDLQKTEREENRLRARMSTTLGSSPFKEKSTRRKRPISSGFRDPEDSWEQDIDWCYEHEAEADCEFQWVEEDSNELTPPATHFPGALELQVQDDERVYHGRFRPSLLVPSPIDPPELSPMSNASTNTISSDPRTPAPFLRPQHMRNHSQASTFKESHGFTLSPSLLIPGDFQTQMDHEVMYNEQFTKDSASATIFPQEQYNPSISSIDEGESSTASFRSSNFSRDSARSSSSTRLSGLHSRESQDSTTFLHSRAASINQAQCSPDSTTSLPDLIASGRAPPATDLSAKLTALQLTSETPSTDKPILHCRNKSSHFDQSASIGPAPSTLPPLMIPRNDTWQSKSSLTPVAETLPFPALKEHGRKISAPVSPSVREFKSRSRAMTGPASKRRGSYMLFPQV